jgi:hypothetical protein
MESRYILRRVPWASSRLARASAFRGFRAKLGDGMVGEPTATFDLTPLSNQTHGLLLVSSAVLFPGHLLCYEHFFSCPRQPSPATAVENDRLTRAVKN